MKIVLGIDPGLSGALAFFQLDALGLEAYDVVDMPTISNPYGKGNVVDMHGLAALMSALPFEVAAVYIEVVAAMPNQGAASMFKFGAVSAAPEAMAIALGYRVIKLKPNSWKKEMKLINKPKDASLALARDYFPRLGNRLNLAKHEGRAEALLIGLIGHKLHGGLL